MMQFLLFILFIFWVPLVGSSKNFNSQIVEINQIPEFGILLDKGWKFYPGDHPDFANPDFDDRDWEPIDPTLDIYYLPQMKSIPIGWLRIHLRVDSTLLNKPLAFQIMQHIASEIYLNGVLVKKYGSVSAYPDLVKGHNPRYEPLGVQFSNQEQVIAIRFSYQPRLPYFGFVRPFHGFLLNVNSVENTSTLIKLTTRFQKFNYVYAGLFLSLFLIHLVLFVVYRQQKANLFFALSTFFFGIGNVLWPIFHSSHNLAFIIKSGVVSYILLWTLFGMFLFLAIHTLFSSRKGFSFWFLVFIFPLGVPVIFLSYKWGVLFGMLTPLLLGTAEAFRISLKAYRKGTRGVGIVLTGLGSFFAIYFFFLLMLYGVLPYPSLGRGFNLMDLLYHLSVLSIPISLSGYLSLQHAYKTKDLEKKLIEVELLTEKTIKQEQEKQQILESQKTLLEKEVIERTHELQESVQSLKSTQTKLIHSEKMATLAQKAEALRLKELDTVKTKLYTNITHEFRTPLTVIMGVANQVLENPNEHLRKGLKMIMRNGQNLLTLVNQMLDLSKLESGKLSLQYHHADIVSFLGYIIDSFHSLAENKGIQIHFISVKDQLNMDFDEVRLQQVVSNILSNALKFTPKGGHVYVSTDLKSDSFILKIKDTGIGIAEADLPHIFDRFFQADDSQTRHGEGTGIGLALTHELVKLMKGTIAVKSKEGQGAEFEVVLPIRNITDSKETTNPEPSESLDTISEIEHPVPIDEEFESSLITPFQHDNGSAHVLVADDNEDVLTFVASCLENEFAVEVAKNGQECEEMAFNTTPDLIVMDVMMPFKDGFEVCKTLKTDERTSHIPIILLTAKADLDSRLQGLEQGADDYLTKPFHKKELLLRIKNLLDLRRQLQQYYRTSLEDGLSTNSLNQNGSGSKSAPSGTQKPSIPLASSLENGFVIKVRKTIEANLEEPDFDVEKLCRSLALSHSQVHRKLSALTGLSATHFIRYVRLVKAKEMILKSGFSITAIAYDCGFNDPAYFSRIFKQEFGMSPQVWREENST